MNIEKYIGRIGYKGSRYPDLRLLKELHISHLYNIPFENLDIHNNKRIILDADQIENKIINNLRGGYCYELNSLFYLLLKELGFNAKIISARVSNEKGGWGKEYDHLAIMVKLEDELLLADVGFGDSFMEPIKFELDTVQKKIDRYFKITKYDEEYYKMSKSPDGKEFSDEYIFTLNERSLTEFEEMNDFHQTSPDSHFTRNKVCSLANEDGRITITNDKLIIFKEDGKSITELKSGKEFDENLLKYFGIKQENIK